MNVSRPLWLMTAAPVLVVAGYCAVAMPRGYAQSSSVTLTATPSSVIVGQSSTLTTTVQVTGPTNGSVLTRSDIVSPTTTTVYTVSVGTSTASATVTVTAAPPPPAAAWTPICTVTGNGTTLISTCGAGANVPNARGFAWKMPYDSLNGELLLLSGSNTADTIYSFEIWGYSARTHAFIKRIGQPAVTDNTSACGWNGGPGALLNPLGGHPLGFMAFDSSRGWYLAQGGLCQGYGNGKTSIYDAALHAMRPTLPKWEKSPLCDGQLNCSSSAFDTGMEFVAGIGKTITCCNGGSQYNLRMTEFDGATYTDVSPLLMGADAVSCANGSSHCPTANTNVSGLLSDGTSLWLFGGCGSSSPTNNPAECLWSGAMALKNDLFHYIPATHVWTKMAPAGGVKPPTTNTAFPWIFYDSKRARLVFYNGTQLWQYLVATNTWSTFTASGSGPVMDLFQQNHSDANAAGYDPVADIGVLTYSRGQGVSHAIFELRFSGS